MTNAFIFVFIMLMSLGVLAYATTIQYMNKGMIQGILEKTTCNETIFFYGNKAYRLYLDRRIKQLKLSLFFMFILLVVQVFNLELINNAPIIHTDILLIFSGLWGAFFLILTVEFMLILRYRNCVFGTSLEGWRIERKFKVVRATYDWINRLIQVVCISCAALMIIIIF